MIRVFIENEAGSAQKNLYNEKTLEPQGSETVSRSYPFPYGFVLETTNEDGDNLDCYILTERPLRTGDIVECDPIGMMEQIEDGEEDNNILAVMPDEAAEVTDEVKERLADFSRHVFGHLPGKEMSVGGFKGREAAEAYIEAHQDEGVRKT